jgi:hypothetical protein
VTALIRQPACRRQVAYAVHRRDSAALQERLPGQSRAGRAPSPLKNQGASASPCSSRTTSARPPARLHRAPKKLGAEVVSEQVYPGEKEFSPYLTKIKEQNVD